MYTVEGFFFSFFFTLEEMSAVNVSLIKDALHEKENLPRITHHFQGADES